MAANTDRKKKAENPNKDYRGRRNIFGQVKDKQTNITTERNDKTGKTIKLVSASGKYIRFWDTDTYKLTSEIVENDEITCLTYIEKNCRLYVGFKNGLLKFHPIRF